MESSTTFTYTKAQLELLSRCMDCNENFSDALFVFFDSAKIEPIVFEALNWLRHAEKIKANPKYIEQQFDRVAQPLHYMEVAV